MQEKCQEAEKYFSEYGPLNLWGPVRPNSRNTPKSGPVDVWLSATLAKCGKMREPCVSCVVTG